MNDILLVTRSEASGISFGKDITPWAFLDHISNPPLLGWAHGAIMERVVGGGVASFFVGFARTYIASSRYCITWPLCSSAVTRSEAVGGWWGQSLLYVFRVTDRARAGPVSLLPFRRCRLATYKSCVALDVCIPLQPDPLMAWYIYAKS